MSSSVQSSEARQGFPAAKIKPTRALLRRADEDICPYVVRDPRVAPGSGELQRQCSGLAKRSCAERVAASAPELSSPVNGPFPPDDAPGRAACKQGCSAPRPRCAEIALHLHHCFPAPHGPIPHSSWLFQKLGTSSRSSVPRAGRPV